MLKFFGKTPFIGEYFQIWNSSPYPIVRVAMNMGFKRKLLLPMLLLLPLSVLGEEKFPLVSIASIPRADVIRVKVIDGLSCHPGEYWFYKDPSAKGARSRQPYLSCAVELSRPSWFALMSCVLVERKNGKDKTVYRVNLRKIIKDPDSEDFRLQDGDVISFMQD